jgi:hypothetical protein
VKIWADNQDSPKRKKRIEEYKPKDQHLEKERI